MQIDRRKSLLKRLLQSGKGEYNSVEVLAKELAASEKTIRTDLKALDSLLIAYPDTHIIRRPGFGVCLETTEVERLALFEWIKGEKLSPRVSQKALSKQILQELLLQWETGMTMQRLADKLYVGKSAIRHELREIGNWLKDFHLKLVRKPNVGLQIEGKEKDWRAALSELFSRTAQGYTKEQAINMLVSHQDFVALQTWILELQRAGGVDFTDAAASNLAVHLAVALKRIKDKRIIWMPDDEIQMIREKPEFEWAQVLADRIMQSFAIGLPEPEIAYFSLHLMGAKRQTLIENDAEAFTLSILLVREMENLISQPFSKDRELVTGIAIHLHSVLNRLRFGLRVKNPLLSQIKEMYRYPFEALLLAVAEIAKPMGILFPEDEVGYLTLHFQAALERLLRNNQKPVRALLVCSTGTGTSQLLSSRVTRIFPEIHVAHVTSLSRLDAAIEAYHPDVIISTVPLQHSSIPSVAVSALFPESDRMKVETFIAGLNQAKRQYATIGHLANPELVFINPDLNDKSEALAYLAEKLTVYGYTDAGYGESARARERISSTAIGGGIAIPHGESRYIRKSGIAIARLQQPLDWDGERVKLVFMLAITFDNRSQTEQLFREMADLVDDESVLNCLAVVSTAAAFISCLEGRTS